MNMKFLICLFSIVLFYNSCGSRENKEALKSKNMDAGKIDTSSLATVCIQRDTTTPMGTKIHYLYTDQKFQISWGDDSYNRVYAPSYSCNYDKNTGVWDFVPKFITETKNNLVFKNILSTSSGGNPAPLEYYAIVLPKNRNDVAFEKDLFLLAEGDYLVYGDFQSERIHLINIETKKGQTIVLKPEPAPSRSPVLSIQQVKINGRKFYIKYESLNKQEEIKMVDKTIEIGI